VSRQLVRQGARVAMLARSLDKLEAAKTSIEADGGKGCVWVRHAKDSRGRSYKTLAGPVE
jgi:NADP-dependent 3-hydroxy acid dehydrogenase YdfG